MPIKRGAARNAYNAAQKRRKEEAGRNWRIKAPHLGRQALGPVDAEPLRRVHDMLKTVIKYGGNPMHTIKRK